MLGKMFRTKLDLELILRRDSGPDPPFFCLRESITDIINQQVEEPEVGLQETYVFHMYLQYMQ